MSSGGFDAKVPLMEAVVHPLSPALAAGAIARASAATAAMAKVFTMVVRQLRLLVPASLLEGALAVLGAEISDEELAAQAESAGQVEPAE
jgi:hypothetical protein